MRLLAVTVCLVFGALGAEAAQQQGELPLGDLARRTEADRTAGKKAAKTYSNADLGETAVTAGAEPVTAGYMSASLGKPVTAEEIIERSQAKVAADSGATQPEEHWRGRADFIRTEAARAHARYEQLSGDATAASSLVAQSSNAQEKRRIQQMLDGLARQWDRLEESARVAKINPDWIGARPNFSL